MEYRNLQDNIYEEEFNQRSEGISGEPRNDNIKERE